MGVPWGSGDLGARGSAEMDEFSHLARRDHLQIGNGVMPAAKYDNASFLFSAPNIDPTY
jgi:hypothetical protein